MMAEKRAIVMATLLGAVILVLLIIVIRPFSRFEKEYPMTMASGSAVSGSAGVPGSDGSYQSGHAGSDAPGPGTDGPGGSPGSGDGSAEGSGGLDGNGDAASGSGAGVIDSVTGSPLVHATGGTLESRIDVPQGFTRTEEEHGSLGEFLRGYKLKKDGAPVLLYNKEPKSSQNAHIAVFKLPIENEDLQQCADSVMRVYAEYFRATDQAAKIRFSLSDTFVAEYQKWRDGYRIIESGTGYEWEDRAEFDPSDANFKKFMRIVFAYSGTYSLETDSKKVKLKDIQIGDIFLQAGSPGHVVMVVDMCEDESGRKAFLLAQGYMPAQQFHLLKNPEHEEDPWYYADEVSYPLKTPEYAFDKDCLRRPKYGEE